MQTTSTDIPTMFRRVQGLCKNFIRFAPDDECDRMAPAVTEILSFFWMAFQSKLEPLEPDDFVLVDNAGVQAHFKDLADRYLRPAGPTPDVNWAELLTPPADSPTDKQALREASSTDENFTLILELQRAEEARAEKYASRRALKGGQGIDTNIEAKVAHHSPTAASTTPVGLLKLPPLPSLKAPPLSPSPLPAIDLSTNAPAFA